MRLNRNNLTCPRSSIHHLTAIAYSYKRSANNWIAMNKRSSASLKMNRRCQKASSLFPMTANTESTRIDMSAEDAVKDLEDHPIPPSDLTAANHPRCIVCRQPASGNCPRCRNMWYCSEECVWNDKTAHQGFCASFADLKAAPQQGNRAYFRSIYLPAQEHLPQFVWLEYAGHGTKFQPDASQMDRT